MRRRELLATAKDTTAGSVDLGLSVKWAEGNIVKNGTEYSIGTPTDRGCYFSWGNVVGHNKGEGYVFDTSNYKSTPGYKLNTSIFPTSGYDAARATLGGNWRLPTYAECQQLIDNCTWVWTTVDGVNGYMITSKKSGYTNNSIFIPASGYYDGVSLYDDGTFGNNWSSTLDSSSDARYLFFSSSNQHVSPFYRYCGFTVRAVQ